jgi:hypothetical protein
LRERRARCAYRAFDPARDSGLGENESLAAFLSGFLLDVFVLPLFLFADAS